MKEVKKIGRRFSMVSLFLAFAVLACLQNMNAGSVSSGQTTKEVKIEEPDHEDYVIQPSIILIADH
jgi:hypothetical protein